MQLVSSRIAVTVLAIFAGSLWTVRSVAFQDDARYSSCPSLRDDPTKINDYRSRNSTEFLKWSIEDNWVNHTGPAINRIQAGEVSHGVMADLDFTLRGWPNHLLALKALIDYTLAGGKQYEFPLIKCYFAHAHRFMPDDVSVFTLEGYLHWKQGDLDQAEKLYLEALRIDESSADVHYNLGLLYFDRSEYEKALTHAQVAYAAGYPLPGLRRKLEEVGGWRDPLPGSPEKTSSDQ